MADQTHTVCDPTCESVFDRVVVSYLLRGGTQVMWELRDDFGDEPPYTFQLQVGATANSSADDWEDVGSPVTNAFLAVDGEQRVYGKTNYTHYRVKLTTSIDTYYSDPVGLLGTLSRRDWRLAREQLRQELVRMRIHAGQRGVLLKKRVSGQKCTNCVDTMTGEIRIPDCQYCYGTGFLCGYYYPIDCVWADISPERYRKKQHQSRGTVNDIVVSARMLNTMMLSTEDLWVNLRTDDRYWIHRVQNIAEMRGVSLVANVELRPAPVTDVAYDIDIPQQEDLLSV